MSYVAVVFVVGLLIAIHEYGHLLAAKAVRDPRQAILAGLRAEGLRGQTRRNILLALLDSDRRLRPAGDRAGRLPRTSGVQTNHVCPWWADGQRDRGVHGLFVLGLAQFNLPVFAATSFAATRLWTGLQQQIAGLSALVTGRRSSQRDRRHRGHWRRPVRIHVHQLADVLGADQSEPGGDEPVAAAAARRWTNSLLRARKDLPARRQAEVPVTFVGWAMVLALMVYATVQDVGRILA